jgi:hypothetical protein
MDKFERSLSVGTSFPATERFRMFVARGNISLKSWP